MKVIPEMESQTIQFIKSKSSILGIGLELGVLSHKHIANGECRGPCPEKHPTKSGTCFSANDQLFHCFNCGIKGDIIDFVRRYKFGSKDDTETFLPALEWLAKKVGIQVQSSKFKSLINDLEEQQKVFAVLDFAKSFFVSSLNNEVIEIYQKRYGFNEKTIKDFCLGYAPEEGLQDYLETHGCEFKHIRASGLFIPQKGKVLKPFFVNRLIFPYLKNRTARYFAGRQTQWTPAGVYEEGRKYKKLPTKKENKGKFVSKFVKNDVIFNCDVVHGARDIVITEGVTDCILLAQLGFSAISPVTIRFSKTDGERLKLILKPTQNIFLCNDNEYSGAGLGGAMGTAKLLSEAGHTVRVMEIPLENVHIEARRKLDAIRK